MSWFVCVGVGVSCSCPWLLIVCSPRWTRVICYATWYTLHCTPHRQGVTRRILPRHHTVPSHLRLRRKTLPLTSLHNPVYTSVQYKAKPSKSLSSLRAPPALIECDTVVPRRSACAGLSPQRHRRATRERGHLQTICYHACHCFRFLSCQSAAANNGVTTAVQP